jgi:hypothetical protein
METKFLQEAAYEVIRQNNWIEDDETINTWEKEMEGDIKSFMKKAMLCIIAGNFEIDDSKNKGYSSLFIITLSSCIDINMYDNKISVGPFEYLIPLNYMRKYKEIFNALKQASSDKQASL